MEKLMPLDLLSSIKGASSSEAVSELFKVIQQAVPVEDEGDLRDALSQSSVIPGQLRSDEVKGAPEEVKELIRKNFPEEKNGYLVVPKVIED